jgi:hypothetical protein
MAVALAKQNSVTKREGEDFTAHSRHKIFTPYEYE